MKLFVSLLFLVSTVAALAQIVPNPGPYTTADGRYTISLEAADGKVTVVEPNKKSVYTKVGGNEYKFVNPTNDIEYRMEVVSQTEIAFFKPSSPDNRTMLSFSGEMKQETSEANYEKYSAIADAYMARIETQPNDTQLWVMCAAAATARARLNEKGFEDYARKSIVAMKALLEDKSKNPCPDVIPNALWSSVQGG